MGYIGRIVRLPDSPQDCHQSPSTSAKQRLPLKSIVEEYKIGKIRTQLMLDNPANTTIREAKLLLKSERKFKAHQEIKKSEEVLKFEETRGPLQCDRHGIGWDLFSTVRAALIVQERREIENDSISKVAQQAQQGQWTTWDEALISHVTGDLVNVSAQTCLCHPVGLRCVAFS